MGSGQATGGRDGQPGSRGRCPGGDGPRGSALPVAHRISCSFTISLLTTTRTRDRQPSSHVSSGTSSRPKWTRLSLCVHSCRSTAVWTTCPSSLQEGQRRSAGLFYPFSPFLSTAVAHGGHPSTPAQTHPGHSHSHQGHRHGPPEVGQGALPPQRLGAVHVGDGDEDWRKRDGGGRGCQTCHGQGLVPGAPHQPPLAPSGSPHQCAGRSGRQ